MEGETQGGNDVWEDAPCLPRAMPSLFTPLRSCPLLRCRPSQYSPKALDWAAGARAPGGTAGGGFGAVRNNSLAGDPTAPKGQEPLLLCPRGGTLEQRLKASGHRVGSGISPGRECPVAASCRRCPERSRYFRITTSERLPLRSFGIRTSKGERGWPVRVWIPNRLCHCPQAGETPPLVPRAALPFPWATCAAWLSPTSSARTCSWTPR